MRKGLGQDIIKRLVDIVGEKYVLTDGEKMEKYSHAETMGYQYFPEAVVMAETAAHKLLEQLVRVTADAVAEFTRS